MLGDHVRQQGSLVSPEYLRFDFSHHGQPTREELDEVFALANDAVLTDVAVETTETSRDEAEKMGAIAFFGDKYGASVRVVQAGPSSLEFCGGTHVDSLGQIGPITLLSEGSIGSNTRRIFAVTGHASLGAGPRSASGWCSRRPSCCGPSPTSCWPPSGGLLERQREAEKELARLRQQSSEAEARTLAEQAAADGGVVVARRDNVEPDALRSLAQAVLRHDGVRAVVLGGSPDGAKVAIAAATGGYARRHPAGARAGHAGRRRRRGLARGGAGGGQGPVADRGGAGRGAAASLRVSDDGSGRRARSGRGHGRVAALDLGTRRIGVAYSDSGRTLASPWGTIERSGDAGTRPVGRGRRRARGGGVARWSSGCR